MTAPAERSQEVDAADPRTRFFDLSMDILAVAGFDGYLKRVNPAFARVSGWSEEELVSRPFSELIHPDDRDTAARELAQFAQGHEAPGLELRLLTRTGGYRWIRWSVRPAVAEALIYAVGTDITDRREAEALVAIHASILARIIDGQDLTRVLDALVREIEEQVPGMIGSVLLMSSDGAHLNHGTAPHLPESYTRAIDGVAIGPSVGSCGTAAYEGDLVVVADIETDERWARFRDLAREHGLRACWSSPIFSGAGEVLGTFAMYYRSPREPDAASLRLIEVGSKLASVAMEHARSEQLRRRDAERFRTIAAEVPAGIFEADAAGGHVYVNERLCVIAGRPASQLLGDGWVEAVHPEDRDRVVARWAAFVADREEWGTEFRVVTPSGVVRHVAVSARALYDDDGTARGFLGSYADVSGAKEAARRQVELDREREIARTLQRSLLPASLPEIPGVQIAARYAAGSAGMEVGGDWYDAFPLPDGRIAVVIGDVMGKGLIPATVMGQLRVAVRVVAGLEPSPGEVVARLRVLAEDLAPDQIVTLVFGILDPRAQTFTFSNAGHPAPLLQGPDGRAAYLEEGRCRLLGVGPATSAEHVTVMRPGALLLLYTDGLIERRGGPTLDEEMERLQRLVEASVSAPAAVCDSLLEAMGARGADDVAILALRLGA